MRTHIKQLCDRVWSEAITKVINEVCSMKTLTNAQKADIREIADAIKGGGYPNERT